MAAPVFSEFHLLRFGGERTKKVGLKLPSLQNR
jgi:hypothetical protein